MAHYTLDIMKHLPKISVFNAKLCEPNVGVLVSTPYYSTNDLRLDGTLSN